jgi:hypothetical protein
MDESSVPIQLTGPLASSWAKWHRGKVHAQSLHALARGLNTESHPLYRLDKMFDEQAGCFIYFVAEVHVTAENRYEWGTVFGDCLNNMRAALDHLAWELVMRGSKRDTLNEEQQAKVQFPIDTKGDDQKFKARCENWLPGVDSMYRLMCRRYQPYKSGNQTLACLADLVGKDKHRVVTPILVRSNLMTLQIVPGSLVGCDYERLEIMTGAERLEPDTVFALVHVRPTGTGQPDMKMSIKMGAAFGLEGGVWIRNVLNPLGFLVTDILREFEAVL